MCEMKLSIYSRTSTAAPLNSVYVWVNLFHTMWWMWLFIHARIWIKSSYQRGSCMQIDDRDPIFVRDWSMQGYQLNGYHQYISTSLRWHISVLHEKCLGPHCRRLIAEWFNRQISIGDPAIPRRIVAPGTSFLFVSWVLCEQSVALSEQQIDGGIVAQVRTLTVQLIGNYGWR